MVGAAANRTPLICNQQLVDACDKTCWVLDYQYSQHFGHCASSGAACEPGCSLELLR
jgi:hypothetical protein